MLTEQELRRLMDLVLQQLSRVMPREAIRLTYSLRYKNGALADPDSLDEVLSVENFGQTAIEHLSIMAGDDLAEPSTTNQVVAIEFLDCRSEDPPGDDRVPIQFKVVGNDRDWVMVTTSLIDERIGKISRLNVTGLTRSRFVRTIGPSIATFVPMVILLAAADPRDEQRAVIEQLAREYASGENRDLGEMILSLERARNDAFPSAVLTWLLPSMLLSIVSVFLLGIGFERALAYAHPPYNFCWGDFAEEFDRRGARVRLGLGVLAGSIVLASLVGVFSNYLSTLLGI